MKKTKKKASEQQQQTELPAVMGSTPSALERKPIVVRDARSAKRLLGRLIVAMQKREILRSEAKDLCYLLSVFVQIHRESDLEERIVKLERDQKEINNGNNTGTDTENSDSGAPEEI